MLAWSLNLGFAGSGAEAPEVVETVKQVARTGQQATLNSPQWVRQYGEAAATDTDRTERPGKDFTKRYE